MMRLLEKLAEVDITPEMAEVLIDLGDMLKGAMPEMAGDEDDVGVDLWICRSRHLLEMMMPRSLQ